MKKHFTGIVTFIVALSMIFSFVGCKQQLEPVLPSDPEIKQESMGFKVTLPSANLSRAGYYTQNDASLYRVELEKDDEDYAIQEGRPGDTLTFTVEDEGTYGIYVTAYNEDGKEIAFGSASKEISLGDGLVKVKIRMVAYEKPDVDIDIEITWDDIVITFDLNGGNVNGDTSNIESGFNQEPPVPTKDGYILKGWTLSLDGDDFFVYYNEYGELVTDDYDFVDEMCNSGVDFTLYAKWVKPEICTLSLWVQEQSYFTSISTGENLGSQLTLEFPQGITLAEIFEINDVNFAPVSFVDDKGYLCEFYEWWIADGSTTLSEDSIILASLELHPGWLQVNQVTFNLNGGNVDGDTSDVIAYVNYFSPNNPVVEPTKEGYVFIGWTLTPDGNDFIEHTDKAVTVYARWAEPLEFFAVGDIVGDFAIDGMPLTYQGEGIYTYEFVYTADTNAWDSVLGTVQFKLRTIAGNWDESYGMASSPILDEKEGFVSLYSGANVVVSGLLENYTYRVTVRCTEDNEVYVRVDTVLENPVDPEYPDVPKNPDAPENLDDPETPSEE